MNDDSPYVAHPRRLADIVAALQALSTYEYASRNVENWKEVLGREPVSASAWREVFADHPEFFRLRVTSKGAYASLVWRRAQPRSYSPELGRHLTTDELSAADENPDAAPGLTNEALSPQQVTSLVEAAIKLHAAALSLKAERRWWVSPLIALAGVAVGALIKGKT